MSKVVHLTGETFEKTLSENPLVMVDFWADWCGPCRMMGPVIEALSEEYDGKALLCKVDIDSEEDLAQQFGVMSIPTIITFKNGKETAREVGVRPAEALKSSLDGNL